MFFETYADCDDDFVRRSLPENLKPFWSVSNMSSATSYYTPALNESFSMLLAKMSENTKIYWYQTWWAKQFADGLWSGSTLSDCAPPCTLTSARVTRGPVTRLKGEYNFVHFYLTEDVRITRVTVDKFNIQEALNFLGSNLGLWPGMGILQLLEDFMSLVVLLKLTEKFQIL